MLDDLRNSAKDSYLEEEPVIQQKVPKPFKEEPKLIFGMTAPQRFIVAIFVLLMVIILGLFILIMFQKIALPV